jgi:hypothetical protein
MKPNKLSRFLVAPGFAIGLIAISVNAQPSYEAAPPSLEVIEDAAIRRAEYLERVNEVLEWRANIVERGDAEKMDFSSIAANLVLGRNIDACSARVMDMLETPGSGPFWMLPLVCVTFSGKDLLPKEVHAAIRDSWRTTYQLRGDTENHFAMYYTMLFLMSELYPNEPGDTWYTGKSSEENLEESRAYLIDWMDIMTTIGQGEFNPTHYIGEYAMPMLFLASWTKDPEMRLRATMVLDWLYAGLAANTLHGVLRGPNSRTDDSSVVERWNSLASVFSWLNFGNTPPTKSYGGWGNYYAVVAANYELPEVIYRIAMDRDGPFEQRDLKRSRHRWRYGEVAKRPIYKTTFMTDEYAVGSYQGGMADPIQTHVWDVTWATPDPRGQHPTMFSIHPYSASEGMQAYFNVRPDTMVKAVAAEGKPSYDVADKLVGCSPYEQVMQDEDTIIAMYDIPKGTRFEQVNGFFSKDLIHLTEDASGWIFAQGGETYLAYYPMAPYHWEAHMEYKRLPSTGGYEYERVESGSQVLISPHLKNGTILQAAAASEFSSFEDFKQQIRNLPLKIDLESTPEVQLQSLRGKEIRFKYGSAPMVDGKRIDYDKWKLFEGPYLNAEKGSRKLEITHGRLKRTLDFNTLTISDTVLPR